MGFRYLVVIMIVCAVFNTHEAYTAGIRCRAYKGEQDEKSQDYTALNDFCKVATAEVMIGHSPTLISQGIEPYGVGTCSWIFLAFRNEKLIGFIGVRPRLGQDEHSGAPIAITDLVVAKDECSAIASTLLRSAAFYLSGGPFFVRDMTYAYDNLSGGPLHFFVRVKQHMTCTWYAKRWWEPLGFHRDQERFKNTYGACYLYEFQKNAVDMLITRDGWCIEQPNMVMPERQSSCAINRRPHYSNNLISNIVRLGGALGVGLIIGYCLGRLRSL